jgi:hypothetical protein
MFRLIFSGLLLSVRLSNTQNFLLKVLRGGLVISGKIRATIFLALLSTLSACGPSNFDECILENMKGVTSRDAAGAIYSSCRNLFKE